MSNPRSNEENLYTLLNDKIGRTEFERELKEVNDDLTELKNSIKELRETDIKDLQKALIDNQQSGFKRIIAVQGSILLLVVGAVITILIKVIGG